MERFEVYALGRGWELPATDDGRALRLERRAG